MDAADQAARFAAPGIEARAKDHLRRAGLRPTRQRVALYRQLFEAGPRHVTAELLYSEAVEAGIPISLATVYNTLHHLRFAGLLRQIPVEGGKTYFDTSLHDHAHFYCAETGMIGDVMMDAPTLPENFNVPEGMEVESVEVIVRLEAKV